MEDITTKLKYAQTPDTVNLKGESIFMDLEIKHRPRTFDEIVGHTIIVEELKKMSRDLDEFPKSNAFQRYDRNGKDQSLLHRCCSAKLRETNRGQMAMTLLSRIHVEFVPHAKTHPEKWHRDIQVSYDGSKIEKRISRK